MSERVELVLPGATSDELVVWAAALQELNPISTGVEPFRPAVGLLHVDETFMGIELVFMAGRRPLLTLALFADLPNEKEREIMEAEAVDAEGL